MKIVWKGKVFNPTGIATANREYIKALVKRGHKVQAEDLWHDVYDFNKGLEFLNLPINVNDKEVVTIFFDYPHHFKDGYGKLLGGSVHEGTRLFPGWAENMNKMDAVWAPSNAVKNLFKWNGVEKTIYVIPHGYDPEVYNMVSNKKEKLDSAFTFLSINSWTGEVGDRKGTELLVKAFDDEFKPEENVRLLLKFGTFWQAPFDTRKRLLALLGHENKNILVNDSYLPEKELAEFYQNADVFVAPTRGEGFGLTILNSLACGTPVIVTKDNNSGHMDFCKGNEGVLWVDSPRLIQGDPRFYCQGNLLAEPNVETLRKQMRYAFEHREEMLEKGKKGREFVKDWTWDAAAQKIEKMIEEVNNGQSS
jgi:glycosyltransferase involved in cell wall biosynthesis